MPTNFAELPDALHEAIAARLAPRDLAMLACVNRNLRDTLRPMSASHRVVAQASGMHDLSTLRDTLQAVLTMAEGQALPAAARTALAAWIQHIPEMQIEAFGESLQMCARMRPGPQAAVLTALGPVLAKLPVDKRDEACRHLLDAIGALPARHGIEPLQGVVTQLAALPVVSREAAFGAVLQLAVRTMRGLHGAVLEALAVLIGSLPAEARPRSFQRVLDAAADDQLARLIVQLGPVISQLPRGARLSAFQGLRQSVARTPVGEQGTVLAALASLVAALPREAQRTAIQVLLQPAP